MTKKPATPESTKPTPQVSDPDRESAGTGACCPPTKLATCCAPEERTFCCSPAATSCGCGCGCA